MARKKLSQEEDEKFEKKISKGFKVVMTLTIIGGIVLGGAFVSAIFDPDMLPLSIGLVTIGIAILGISFVRADDLYFEFLVHRIDNKAKK